MKAIPLETVRPFILDEVVLSSEDLDANDADAVVEFLANKVELMIAKAEAEYPRTNKNMPNKPLIRLKVIQSTQLMLLMLMLFFNTFIIDCRESNVTPAGGIQWFQCN